MKAEKINLQFEAQKIHSQFGTTEMANYKIQKLCESYAKDQIEKDRVDAANNFQPRCITQEGQLKQMQSIVNRPIILE